ncbi:TonB-dependent receptor PqqU [Ravibacter arvi]|uniref:TonB-dependent receptor PqqU n=1 Tax=Ravibacter arvi TaxID=2051041 RepID=A0ABP8M8C2_9BACT
MKSSKLILATVLGVFACSAASIGQSDSVRTKELDAITVHAYGSKRSLLESTASVGVLSKTALDRFSPTTWTNAVNTLPGVRMEERSPGSYRFSVRGSMIRSPFGIRNVKFYWNGIPFTDVNGNTALNVLDFGAVARMEVIKGPGSSLYGAGTGGVVLMYGPAGEPGHNQVTQHAGAGQYGLRHYNTEVQLGTTRVQFAHQEQDGFRQQSAMRRDGVTFSTRQDFGAKGTLSLLGSYSDLWYQTPGGLNKAQFDADQRQPRPATPTLPGSAEQNARILSKYLFVGGSHQLKLSERWGQELSLYVSTNNFANPFISNYEKREEQGLGGRNTWQYTVEKSNSRWVWTSGFEWQTGRSVQRNFDNKSGAPGPQQTSEDIGAQQGSVFSQLEASLPGQFTVAGGLSYSMLRYRHEAYFPGPYADLRKTFDGALMPRLSMNKIFAGNWSATASVSRGFSPPTLQEVRPSAGGFRRDLEAETGLNKELTLRYFGGSLLAELTAYSFGLNQTIVRKTDEQGAEYFANAGKTRQNGLEWRLEYNTGFPGTGWIEGLRLWHAGTYAHYTFQDYRVGENDISGNLLPGIPRIEQSTGADLTFPFGIRFFGVYQYGGSFFLNDLNTVENTPYHRFTARAVWNKSWGRHLFSEISASAERVHADIYSLGFDLNAFGNRYYNAAPKKNWYGGLKIGWRW